MLKSDMPARSGEIEYKLSCYYYCAFFNQRPCGVCYSQEQEAVDAAILVAGNIPGNNDTNQVLVVPGHSQITFFGPNKKGLLVRANVRIENGKIVYTKTA